MTKKQFCRNPKRFFKPCFRIKVFERFICHLVNNNSQFRVNNRKNINKSSLVGKRGI